jgi:hypothetical protein
MSYRKGYDVSKLSQPSDKPIKWIVSWYNEKKKRCCKLGTGQTAFQAHINANPPAPFGSCEVRPFITG